MLHDLIIYTDIGDDIDDSLALWYLYKKNHIRNFIIVLYSCEAEKRNHAWELIEPFFEKRPIIVQGHNTSMIEHFLETRKRDIPLDIFCIGPTTDFAHHITNIPQYQKSVNKIIFQARLKYDGGVFIPDSDSYNYKQDVDATSVIVALHIPLFRIGKYTAYQIGLTEKHFKKRGKSGIGKILYKEGLHWKMNFAMINPAKYQQVYGHYPHVISFPYDLIAAVAMYHPQYFQRVHQEQNSCCGHDVEYCFKVDKSVIYNEIDNMFI